MFLLLMKKIPGIDDATQMLGQDMIKYIRRKNLSASYCQSKHFIHVSVFCFTT